MGTSSARRKVRSSGPRASRPTSPAPPNRTDCGPPAAVQCPRPSGCLLPSRAVAEGLGWPLGGPWSPPLGAGGKRRGRPADPERVPRTPPGCRPLGRAGLERPEQPREQGRGSLGRKGPPAAPIQGTREARPPVPPPPKGGPGPCSRGCSGRSRPARLTVCPAPQPLRLLQGSLCAGLGPCGAGGLPAREPGFSVAPAPAPAGPL